ncbi:Na+/H+ antiporter NhaC [Moraxella macacae 0408225]|uniref:Na+/H+ antiporter NhaC n=1 Tax=Moraxella macacae 0408225 TaxID=1230338 RepID=L2F6D2_9GAMM|nr:Na+/H+ antiporter family protein [Moraxella macacae]ELA08356.1 Na+/H+ antiporter NhaC [Moraxella macacae 0408225]
MLTNAVLWAVIVMLILSLSRIHVVLSLIIGAVTGGLIAGLPLTDVVGADDKVITTGVLTHFQNGLKEGAMIALSYALLGAFAVAISHSGMPKMLAQKVILSINANQNNKSAKLKWLLISGILAMSVASQNLIPIHIAFIPLVVSPLLLVFNRLQIDRRLLACVMTFGLVNTYMFLPYGFGDIYLNQIILKNISEAGLNVTGLSVMSAMAIPALGMIIGLLVAIFISYRKPRVYRDLHIANANTDCDDLTASDTELSNMGRLSDNIKYRTVIALIAIVVSFVMKLYTDSLILGALTGFGVFMATGVVKWSEADSVFNDGIKLLAMIGFIMITAQGFAEVMNATGQIQPLVDASSEMFAGSKGMAAFAMLLIGLVVTMGIGSSFSTVPIIATIYVPLCISMGFSPLATVSIIATAGALGDAGSPASDSTLGPTMGLNVDDQHNHIYDSVVPTFLHYNLPLLIFGWIAAMVL